MSARLLRYLAVAIFALGGLSHAPSVRAAPPPNILFVLADDQRSDTIHALGNAEIDTPVLDGLVARGFHFTNAYCQGSMTPAVCLPSRTMILTGRSLWRIPQDFRTKEPPPGVPLLPLEIKAAGYKTFHSGKPDNVCRYANAAFDTNLESAKNRNSATEHVENVIAFVRAHDGTQPFFAFLAPPVPHDPRWAPDEFVRRYEPARLTLSKNFLPQHPFDNGELLVRDEKLAPFPRTPAEMRQHLADYYASITHFDHELGRLLAALAERGWLDNTVIIYTSDQGLAVGGRHGLMGKQNLYEHVKPPLILAGPGIPQGRSEALVYLFDLFPTICELAGAAPPPACEGASLLPIVRGKATSVRPTLFAAYREWQRMVRDDRWKLIAYDVARNRRVQLFDLAHDGDELHDLAGDPQYASERKRLTQQMAEQRTLWGDPIDFHVAE